MKIIIISSEKIKCKVNLQVKILNKARKLLITNSNNKRKSDLIDMIIFKANMRPNVIRLIPAKCIIDHRIRFQ